MRKYTIEVNIPTLRVIGDDKQTYTFSLMTKQILNEWNVEVNENDEIAFTTTVKWQKTISLQKDQIRN
jgi:hypothetical protein